MILKFGHITLNAKLLGRLLFVNTKLQKNGCFLQTSELTKTSVTHPQQMVSISPGLKINVEEELSYSSSE
jgi:hypothetical protein